MNFQVVVKAIIIDEKDNLLIVKRSENDKINPERITVPGGFINFGEKPKDAVKREVKEEINLDVEITKVTSVWTSIIKEEDLQIIGINYLCKPLTKNILLNDELSEYL
ncbi:MAG: NUDIX domain-containing protein [Nanoarchaeota archaeon]|nr:NUDIX domain-containing protein [Nanoarchaeota archaeon]MBU1632022.1 NUDIX domain-containing protein [Nanoarchaeota archaeon]MBU1875970.1 NUDIX domain-containing protein [Nanoarchaeota archaeon]